MYLHRQEGSSKQMVLKFVSAYRISFGSVLGSSLDFAPRPTCPTASSAELRAREPAKWRGTCARPRLQAQVSASYQRHKEAKGTNVLRSWCLAQGRTEWEGRASRSQRYQPVSSPAPAQPLRLEGADPHPEARTRTAPTSLAGQQPQAICGLTLKLTDRNSQACSPSVLCPRPRQLQAGGSRPRAPRSEPCTGRPRHPGHGGRAPQHLPGRINRCVCTAAPGATQQCSGGRVSQGGDTKAPELHGGRHMRLTASRKGRCGTTPCFTGSMFLGAGKYLT